MNENKGKEWGVRGEKKDRKEREIQSIPRWWSYGWVYIPPLNPQYD